jgi:hypothetical protein
VTLDGKEVSDKVAASMNGNYFLFVPEKNIFFYPAAKIKQALLRGYPRLAEVAVSPESLTSLLVTATERKPEYQWCTDDDTCYFMDQSGFVFDKAPTYSGNVYFEFRGEASSSPLGRTVLPADAVENIISFKKELDRLLSVYGDTMTGKITRVTVLDGGDYEFRIVRNDAAKTAWKIIFSRGQMAQALLDNIETAFNAIANGKHPGKTLSDLEYMDLRFGRKVFYKFVGSS